MSSNRCSAGPASFDHAAADYDEVYGQNWIMRWMRNQSLAALRAWFRPGSRLLELGCGTGEEALALRTEGYRIVATEPSQAMLERARSKERGAVNPVQWRCMGAGAITSLLDEFGPEAFQGAYASFGPMNCEPRPDRVAGALARLLSHGSPFICSVMNRVYPWEIAWYLATCNVHKAFRRLRKEWTSAGLAASCGSVPVPVRYYTPREFAGLFQPAFDCRWVRGFPCVLPPPYLAERFHEERPIMRRLAQIDAALGARFPFRAYGDHFLMVLRLSNPVGGMTK